jgi:hypothetical protein
MSFTLENKEQQASLVQSRKLYLQEHQNKPPSAKKSKTSKTKPNKLLSAGEASEEIGKIIVSIFKNQNKPNGVANWFSKMVSRVRSQYPTNNHINKFVVGLACEYLFSHALATMTKPKGLPVFLCSDSEKRNDVYYWKGQTMDKIDGNEFNSGITVLPGVDSKFGYSIKYQSAGKCQSIQKFDANGNPAGRTPSPDFPVLVDVKMINNIAVGKKSKSKEVDEDVFIIVSNRKNEKGKDTLGKILFIPRTHYKYMWGAERKPYEIFYQKKKMPVLKMTSATIPTNDGAILRKEFLNVWLRDPGNASYWTDLDIPIDASLEKIDSIALLLGPIVGKDIIEKSPIFLCRQMERSDVEEDEDDYCE